MSAKSKKRLCKLENKLLKLEKLELKDVVCSICQSILVEPVALPCFHYFCHGCFNGSVENNALCCPLCRLRIGSWLRTATKQNSLVNVELWNFIQNKFPKEIAAKLKGDDLELQEDIPTPRLSAPGEIRSEYEAELQRLQAERLKLEQKHIQETQLLIKQIQKEEQEAQKQYLERIKQDEQLAKELQNHERKSKPTTHRLKAEKKRKRSLREALVRPKLKVTKIDGYLAKIQAPISMPIESPLLTNDNSTDRSTPKSVNGSNHQSTHKTVKTDYEGSSVKSQNRNTDSSNDTTNESSPKTGSVNIGKLTPIAASKENNRLSPEIVPRNGKLIRNLNDKNNKGSSIWNKENGEKEKEEKKSCHPPCPNSEAVSPCEDNEKKTVIKSLLVSLPLPNSGVLHHKTNVPVTKAIATDTESVDSMRQELCFFKPIEKTSPTSLKPNRKLPVRVPSVRPEVFAPIPPPPPTPTSGVPTRAQYLDSLCRLRRLSLTDNMKSAFVIALNSLKVLKNNVRYNVNARQGTKRNRTDDISTMPAKKVAPNKKSPRVPNNTKSNSKTSLRRTRSMGSMVKDENETTPKKAKIVERRAISDRKPHLRSDTKKEMDSPPLVSKMVNNNEVKLAVKNLSSPLKNCDVEQILQEQLRIEKIIEQEKKDLEFARKMDAEWNGRRQLRRAPAKRQVTLNYALRPAKKVKV